MSPGKDQIVRRSVENPWMMGQLRGNILTEGSFRLVITHQPDFRKQVSRSR